MAAAGGAAHGFRGISQRSNGRWEAYKHHKIDGKSKKLSNGQSHATPEEAAHAYDCMLFYLEDDPDYNLPERMTADVKNVLNQHKDVFEYLEAQKKVSAAKVDANFRKGASKFRGVSFNKNMKSKPWRSQIKLPGQSSQLEARFATEEEAAHDYDRKAIRRDGRKAPLNFPLETYADEFSAAELDAIDARVAAGKPPLITAASAKTKGKGKGKAGAAFKPRQQRGGGRSMAAAAAGEASGSGGGGGGGDVAEEEQPDYEEWEEEWEEPAATVKDDPATWTREQREAYQIMHPYDDIFTPEELDELSEDVKRLSIKDDYEEFKHEKWAEVRRKCEADVARCTALLKEVRGTEDELYVSADLVQAQKELEAWEAQVPPSWLMWQMFEEDQMTRFYTSMRQRMKTYPLTYEALYSEDRWFNPLTGQPNVTALQSSFRILESDLPQMMRILNGDDEKDKYVVKMLRIRRFLDAHDMEVEGRTADELVQLRWALGRDEDVDEEDPEESFGVFDASDEEEEEPPPAAAFPANFSFSTVDALLAGIVDATHGIFERAETGPAAAAGQPPNAPANPRFERPTAAAAAGDGGGGTAPAPRGVPAAGSGAAAGCTAAAAGAAAAGAAPRSAPAAPAPAAAPSAQPAAAASAPAPSPAAPAAPAAPASSAPAGSPAFAFGSGAAPPTGFGGFAGLAVRTGGGSVGGGSTPAPFQFGSGAAPPATSGWFAGGGGSVAASAPAFSFGFGSGDTPPAAFGGFGGLSGGSRSGSCPASAPAFAFGGLSGLSGGGSAAAAPFGATAAAGQPFGTSAGGSGGSNSTPAPASFAFPPYRLPAQPLAAGAGGSGGPATPAGGAAGSAGASGSQTAGRSGVHTRGTAGVSSGGSAGASGSKPAAPSGWLNIENFGDVAAADPQVRADWHYEMTHATPSGPGGQFTVDDYARMLANLMKREKQRQAEGHKPGWNGAPDIRSEEEQEEEAEAEDAAWQKEKAAIEARMAELQREGAKLVNHIKTYTWDVQERMREKHFQMAMCYWEGQCLAHMRAGHDQWLEDLMGPSWREHVSQVGVTTPHLFGTYNWRDSLPPIDPALDIIFMEMTGFVANMPLSEGLAGAMGWTALPTLDDATLAIWFNVICEQARMGLPTIGLAPVESWAPGCTKWDWKREMRERGKKFTCSHPWLFLQRMRPIRLHGGFDYPPGTPDVVRPSVQRAMRQSCEERDAMQLRAAEQVAELVRTVAAAAEAGVQTGRMHHGVASASGAGASGSGGTSGGTSSS